MARSKKNDSDIDSDIDSDHQDDDNPLPPTNEDTFNNIFRGGTTLPTRIRNKPHRHGDTPSPQLPPTTKKKKTKKKKKITPLVNSDRTNSSNNNNNKRNRGNKSSIKKSSNASIAPAPLSSVAPHSSLATNVQHAQQCKPSGAPILQNDFLLSTSVPNGTILS